MQPLILTVWMDDASFARVDGLRRAYFPPDRNVISAHITLFHQLPGTEVDNIVATLRSRCAAQPAFAIEVTALRSLGRGVALALASEPLAQLRASLAQHWSGWLGAQDRQGFRPHITVQNKVTPEAARDLLQSLSRDFQPSLIRAEGLALWRYLGGPWERVLHVPFQG